ncbi:hypothetical protein GHT06_021375 [Daphnia sinensis]|uniref:Uncharacterized protein n=1 Tax=Daphnia sinensis TaxID=1820382 RepID=A0AAD5KZI8_9CRUS|nr:hypothetical protein GHT06_021375 [Daphnia sinensis]
MGLHTVEVSSAIRPGSLIPLPPPPTTGTATAADVEKGASSADQWGKNMQRWRNDNIDIGKGTSGSIFKRPLRKRCSVLNPDMGPIDPEGGDMKAIVAGSPSSGSSSLNMTSPVVIAPVIDERPTMTTITVTGVDGTLQTNGEAASTGPVQTPDVASAAQPCGYSSAYVTNRMHNTQLGGKWFTNNHKPKKSREIKSVPPFPPIVPHVEH